MRIRTRATVLLAIAASSTTLHAKTTAVRQSGLVVERVVILMRHGVRPSTKFPATPVGTTRQPWSTWSTAAGDLTPHGAEGVSRLGAYGRSLLVGQGLLPAHGCAASVAIAAWSSASPRAIKTGKAYLEALQPGCAVPLDHPAGEDGDALFHPSDADVGIDGAAALAAAEALTPHGGMAAEVAAQRQAFDVLDRVTGVAVDRSSVLKASSGDKPDLKGGLSFGSTAGQTILLEYLEGKPMAEVGWGRASKADIQTMLRFHPVKFRYETRPAYVAERLAAPIARRMLDALDGGPAKITLLFGHDTNIAALGGFYGLHWTMADYPRDDIAPGGAVGFELLRDGAGKRYVRAFQQAQTMDQLRTLAPLGVRNPAKRAYIAIPGCGGAGKPCDLDSFRRITQAKLEHPAAS